PLLNIPAVKGVAALRAELGGMLGVFRLPAALVAPVQGLSGGGLGTALGAEVPLVHSAAAALPALFRLLGTAAGAELAGIFGAAGADPLPVSLGLRLLGTAVGAELPGGGVAAAALPGVLLGRLGLGLLTHGIEVLGVHCASGVHGHAHTQKARHGTGRIAGG